MVEVRGVSPSRGLLDKRQAIMEAAKLLFARDGFVATGIDIIAIEASVSRQTIYSHFGDKTALFLAVVDEVSEEFHDDLQVAMDSFPGEPQDLEQELSEFTVRLTTAFFGVPAIALRKLVEFDGVRFPQILDLTRERGPLRTRTAIADHIARFTRAGLLAVPDPSRFARQFMTLIYDPDWHRARLGGAALDLADVRETARANVVLLLRAYAPNKR